MKRLALFIMALIVPMQFAWASIACYSHAEVKNTHFVHIDSHSNDCDAHTHSHSHNFIEHEVGSANGDQHSVHCDACHAHFSTVVQNNYTWPAHKQLYSYTSFNHSFLTLVSPEAPYRPKWL